MGRQINCLPACPLTGLVARGLEGPLEDGVHIVAVPYLSSGAGPHPTVGRRAGGLLFGLAHGHPSRGIPVIFSASQDHTYGSECRRCHGHSVLMHDASWARQGLHRRPSRGTHMALQDSLQIHTEPRATQLSLSLSPPTAGVSSVKRTSQ